MPGWDSLIFLQVSPKDRHSSVAFFEMHLEREWRLSRMATPQMNELNE
jgi:hypothetical protein